MPYQTNASEAGPSNKRPRPGSATDDVHLQPDLEGEAIESHSEQALDKDTGEELNAALNIDGGLEEVNEVLEAWQPSGHQDRREALLSVYRELSLDVKMDAINALPWFARLFQRHKDFSLFLKLDARSSENRPLIRLKPNVRHVSINDAVGSLYDIDGRLACGLELVLALSFALNPTVREQVVAHVRSSTSDRPLDMSCLEKASMKDARRSSSSGVYALQCPQGKWIVGSTGMSFQRRLNEKRYSTSWKVVHSPLGDPSKGFDQRVGRKDHIIYNMKTLTKHGIHIKWISHSLEAMTIVLYGTTFGQGLNTNIVDRNYSTGGRSFAQVHALWSTLKSVTDAGEIVPVNAGSVDFGNWFRAHIGIHHPSETTIAWYKLMRSIAVEAEEGQYKHFPGLVEGAWAGYKPRKRVKGREIFTQIASVRPSDHIAVSKNLFQFKEHNSILSYLREGSVADKGIEGMEEWPEMNQAAFDVTRIDRGSTGRRGMGYKPSASPEDLED